MRFVDDCYRCGSDFTMIRKPLRDSFDEQISCVLHTPTKTNIKKLCAILENDESGLLINSRKNGQTALFTVIHDFYSMSKTHIDVIRLLIDHPHTDLNAKSLPKNDSFPDPSAAQIEKYGRTALMRAVNYGLADVVGWLLDDPRVDPTITTLYKENSPFHRINVPLLKVLLNIDPKLDVNAVDRRNENLYPLEYLFGHFRHEDDNDDLEVWYQVSNKLRDRAIAMTKMISADLRTSSHHLAKAISYACKRNIPHQLLKVLLQNPRTSTGLGAVLHYACERLNSLLVEDLLQIPHLNPNVVHEFYPLEKLFLWSKGTPADLNSVIEATELFSADPRISLEHLGVSLLVACQNLNSSDGEDPKITPQVVKILLDRVDINAAWDKYILEGIYEAAHEASTYDGLDRAIGITKLISADPRISLGNRQSALRKFVSLRDDNFLPIAEVFLQQEKSRIDADRIRLDVFLRQSAAGQNMPDEVVKLQIQPWLGQTIVTQEVFDEIPKDECQVRKKYNHNHGKLKNLNLGKRKFITWRLGTSICAVPIL